MSTRLTRGNSATVIGALYAGCEVFFGYPITPASEIAHEAAEFFPRLGRCFLQAESETAAINMLYGTAATGRRAMTGSSGPGISLMQEGLSYMAAVELPCVIVDIMRAGPGLGNIGPEQGDYNQMVKGGGHGNYRLIVLAPASVQEMCTFTMQAFDLAERYRIPAVVLADAVLGQMIEPLRFPDTAVTPGATPDWAVDGTARTRENVITSIFLDFTELEGLNERLQAKYALITEREARAETAGVADAEVIIVAYGICSRIARSACELCRSQGMRVGLFRPQTLWPFPAAELKRLAGDGSRPLLVVEMSNGQMIDDVKLAVDCRPRVELVSRMGGNLMTVEDVAARAAALLNRGIS